MPQRRIALKWGPVEPVEPKFGINLDPPINFILKYALQDQCLKLVTQKLQFYTRHHFQMTPKSNKVRRENFQYVRREKTKGIRQQVKTFLLFLLHCKGGKQQEVKVEFQHVSWRILLSWCIICCYLSSKKISLPTLNFRKKKKEENEKIAQVSLSAASIISKYFFVCL